MRNVSRGVETKNQKKVLGKKKHINKQRVPLMGIPVDLTWPRKEKWSRTRFSINFQNWNTMREKKNTWGATLKCVACITTVQKERRKWSRRNTSCNYGWELKTPNYRLKSWEKIKIITKNTQAHLGISCSKFRKPKTKRKYWRKPEEKNNLVYRRAA